MSWLHRLQQRLSITKNEALTLLSLSLFLLLGTAGRYTCRQMRPVSAEYYAEVDSLFAERSAAALHPEDADPQDAGVKKIHEGDDTASSGGYRESDSLAGLRSDLPRDATADVLGDTTASPRIDLNRATLQELQKLPRVGPKIAQRIVTFRDAVGTFHSVDDLLSVKGIGPKTLELLRPHATVVVDSSR